MDQYLQHWVALFILYDQHIMIAAKPAVKHRI